MTTMNTGVRPATARARCATCDKDLGELNDGPCLPSRLVMRHKPVASAPVGTDTNTLWSPSENWRVRHNVRNLCSNTIRVYEQPYTCDSDACMDALGPEWIGMGLKKKFVRHLGRSVSQ